MKLSELLAPWALHSSDCEVLGLAQDSRHVQAGDLFLAYPGAVVDGRQFIDDALSRGAVAITYEAGDVDVSAFASIVPCVAITDLYRCRGLIASRFYGNPTQALSVIGVTGTNGKTTIAYQLAQAYERLGQRSVYVGTLGQGAVNALKDTSNTTPDTVLLQRFCYETEGLQVVCMEVSSHALDQDRVLGVNFNQAIFTNLTHDHLDYHQTMTAYAQAKAKLFAMSSLKSALVNGDDATARLMMSVLPPGCRGLTYGLHQGVDVHAHAWEMSMTGSRFTVDSPWGQFELHTRMLGEFNLYNSLAVFSSLMLEGYSAERIVPLMRELPAVPGRMEMVLSTPCVIVDYAHTPDALKNVLATLVRLKKRRLVVVFGCGGDRDKTKRALMGQVAQAYADDIILTSDNPRSEEPKRIIDDILAGMTASAAVSVQVDREQAIHMALAGADDDDLILIAGKGHETYQEIGHQRHAFSDQNVIQAAAQCMD